MGFSRDIGLGDGFPVRIGRNWLCTSLTDPSRGEWFEGRRVVLIDRRVVKAEPSLVACLKDSGVHGDDVLLVAGGERSKSVSSLIGILRWLDARKVGRKSERLWIVGGGSIGDVGGLAAALYRRGIPFERFATTPLSAVDSGIAYKSAINFFGRKNLVGTFKAPTGVYIDTELFQSVSRRHLLSGLAEVFKIGLALDVRIIRRLHEGLDQKGALFEPYHDLDIIEAAATSMLGHLARDPFENEGPSSTDLGHCLSRYVEQAVRPRVTHGEAVALEISLSLNYSLMAGAISRAEYSRLTRLMLALGLPVWREDYLSKTLLIDAIDDIERHRDGPTVLIAPTDTGVAQLPLTAGALLAAASLDPTPRWSDS